MPEKMLTRLFYLVIGTIFIPAWLSGCQAQSSRVSSGTKGSGKLQVVATTTILGDVVNKIAGEEIDLTTLLPYGADPHTFEPAPQDLAVIAQADLILINGAGLETFMDKILANAREGIAIINASEGIDFLSLAGEHLEGQSGTQSAGQTELDPHVWFDPQNVIIWSQNIARTLGQIDQTHAQVYTTNQQAYQAELENLDRWIQNQVGMLPADRRKLVTDHEVFGYFAVRYGFEQVGAVIPSFSPGAESSAQQIASLEEKIRALGVPAIFVGKSVNPNLAERIATDTGIQIVPLYTGSLTEPDGEAGTYIELMHFDISAILDALAK